MPPRKKASQAKPKKQKSGNKTASESNASSIAITGDVSAFGDAVATSSPRIKNSLTEEQLEKNSMEKMRKLFMQQDESEFLKHLSMIEDHYALVIEGLKRHNFANMPITGNLAPLGSSVVELMQALMKEQQKMFNKPGSSLNTPSSFPSASGVSGYGTLLRRRSRSEERTESKNLGDRTQIALRSSSEHRLDRFQTPLGRPRDTTLQIATVTPLIRNQLSAQTAILRKPNPGEMAISMSGSPLHVTSDNLVQPSLTVPLADGRILNLQRGAASSHYRLPSELDQNVLESLRDIKNYLVENLPN